MFGLSFLCKELAVVMFGATWLYLIVKRTGCWKQLLFVAVTFAVAFCGLWLYDIVYHPFVAGAVIENPVFIRALLVRR